MGGIGYSYDHKFNLTGAAGFGGVYDAANRLVSAWNTAMAAQAEVQLVYDGLGRCVKRTVAGVAAIIIYDGWKPNRGVGWMDGGVFPGLELLRHDAKKGYVRDVFAPLGILRRCKCLEEGLLPSRISISASCNRISVPCNPISASRNRGSVPCNPISASLVESWASRNSISASCNRVSASRN